jgi:hypothetical protein
MLSILRRATVTKGLLTNFDFLYNFTFKFLLLTKYSNEIKRSRMRCLAYEEYVAYRISARKLGGKKPLGK